MQIEDEAKNYNISLILTSYSVFGSLAMYEAKEYYFAHVVIANISSFVVCMVLATGRICIYIAFRRGDQVFNKLGFNNILCIL